MGVRGVIRDVLALYVSYRIIEGFVSKNLVADSHLLLSSILLFFLTLWFLLEKIGLIRKIT